MAIALAPLPLCAPAVAGSVSEAAISCGFAAIAALRAMVEASLPVV